MKEVAKWLSSFVLGALLGIGFIKFYESSERFKWDGKIGPESFINILIALVIAVFLSQSFQKALEVKKLENSWILDTLKEAAKLLRTMRLDFDATFRSGVAREAMVRRFLTEHRKFSNCLTEATDLVQMMGHRNEHGACQELLMKSTLYKAVITNGNPNVPFDTLDNSKQLKSYTALRKELFEMIIKLGRKV